CGEIGRWTVAKVRPFKPSRLREPRPASYASVYLQLFADRVAEEPVRVGTGTGFFYRLPNRKLILITCWHVLTGRNPDEPGTQLYPQPDAVVVWLARSDDQLHFEPREPM